MSAAGFLYPSIIYLPEWAASIEIIKIGWADKQEVKVLKAVLFGADGVIPVQSHGCECSQDQQQVQYSLRTLGLRAQFHYPTTTAIQALPS